MSHVQAGCWLTIPLSVLLATNGFIKGVVVFQVDWGMLLISAAGGVWNGW